MNQNFMSVIEAGYRLGGSHEAWLDGVLRAAAPLIDHGLPPVAWLHRDNHEARRRVTFATGADAEISHWVKVSHRGNDPRLYELLYHSGKCLGTGHDDLFSALPAEHAKFRTVTAGRASDLLLSAGHTGTGDTVAFAAYAKKRIGLRPGERKRWQQLGAHLGAGLRLRATLGQLDMDQAPVEAVLRPNGALAEARGPSRGTDARERLRQAVWCLEHIRCAGHRLEPDEALNAWEGLVAGRWSLIEHFDSDGRRYIVAAHNDPRYPDPRGLTPRERQVAEYVGMGCSSGQIAYALGIAPSSVTDNAIRAQHKLGLSSWTELAAFFARNGPRARLAELVVGGEPLLAGAYPLLPETASAALTPAEREILAALLAGSTNADIARRRGSSARTVANQIQSVYRKLRVRSRGELAARLLSAG